MPLRVFPVADVPGLSFGDDFGDARSGGRRHAGNDLFAPEGTPVLAPDDGALTLRDESLGGRSFYVRADDGVVYFGTHLSGWEGGERRVRAGEIIGYVGHGGNAAGTPDHLHFEMHPPGQGAVNPYPWLVQAERRGMDASGARGGGGRVLPWLLVLGAIGAVGYAYRDELF
jgi:murein DD-endopeptidase MepM/ murein hydrolase activator NlpD